MNQVYRYDSLFNVMEIESNGRSRSFRHEGLGSRRERIMASVAGGGDPGSTGAKRGQAIREVGGTPISLLLSMVSVVSPVYGNDGKCVNIHRLTPLSFIWKSRIPKD